MDHLWSPWRYSYISQGQSPSGCVFCAIAAETNDEANYVVHRGAFNFALLNLYPYTSGHLMVVPYEHTAMLESAREQTAVEMFLLVREAERHVRTVYRPEGVNIGMNIGSCAGAGVAGHIHMHILPRWTGDANFMSTVGETRVLPEDLTATYQKLHAAFAGVARG